MKWLAALLVFSVAFAQFTRVVDTDVGYAEVSGLSRSGEVFMVEQDDLSARAAVTADFTLLNYSVSLTPRNLQHIAEDMDVPLSGSPGVAVAEGAAQSASFQLPEIVCGTYTVRAEAYYESGGATKRFDDSVKFQIRCKDFKSRLLSGLFARLPYSLLKVLAGWAGFDL
jgi:hypothetical protein